MTNLANRTTLVTGAASGMGLGIAVQVARRGGRVVLWDLDEDRLDEARETVDSAGPQTPLAHRCNVADVDDVNATAARVAADLGSVDVLVNNAGVVSGDWLLDLSDDQIRRTFDVNTLSLFWVTRAFLPDMVERNEGHVVTMASASGLTGVAKLTDYASSKWAAIGFNDSLRQEMRRRAPGVRTTVLCPFYVNTGLFRGVKTRFPPSAADPRRGHGRGAHRPRDRTQQEPTAHPVARQDDSHHAGPSRPRPGCDRRLPRCQHVDGRVRRSAGRLTRSPTAHRSRDQEMTSPTLSMALWSFGWRATRSYMRSVSF